MQIQNFAKELLLGAEGCIEARRGNPSHRLLQFLKRRTLVAARPEHSLCLTECLIPIEGAWSSPLCHVVLVVWEAL